MTASNHPRSDLFGTRWAWFRWHREPHEDQYLAPITWDGDEPEGEETELPLAHVKIEYSSQRVRSDVKPAGQAKPDAFRPFVWDARRAAYRGLGSHRTMAAAKDAVASSLADHKGNRPVIERPLRTIKEAT